MNALSGPSFGNSLCDKYQNLMCLLINSQTCLKQAPKGMAKCLLKAGVCLMQVNI